MSVHWTIPVWMWPLLLFVAAGAVFWTRRTYRQTHPQARPALVRVLVLLRISALLLLLLAIAGPVISLIQTKKQPAEILVLLEDSASMSIADAGPEGLSRWDFALETVRTIKESFAHSDAPVEFRFFRGNGLLPAQEFRLDDAVIPKPVGHGTDLKQLVHSQTIGKKQTPAILLISDGQQTVTPGDARTPNGDTFAAQSPMFVLGVGDPLGAADRLITDLRYPDTAFAGDKIALQLAVAHRFTDGTIMQDMVVRLNGASGELAQKIIAPGASVQSIELEFSPDGEGMHVYELEVSPLDNERFLANNKVSLAIDVQKSRSKVLLLSEFPGWDVRFLAQAALKEPRVELQVVYSAAGGLVYADTMQPWQYPQSSIDWLEWDAVVLTSWSGKLGGLHWDALAEAVGNGLGLVVLPGGGLKTPQIRPLSVLPPVLQDLLPVSSPRWSWEDGDYFLSEDGDLRGHPVLSGVLGSGGVGGSNSGQFLEDLPPLPGVVKVDVKEGAFALVFGSQRNQSTAEARVPVLVVGRQGSGPVAWLGGRRFWETAFWVQNNQGQGGQAYDGQPIARLLRNLLVWASAGAQESGLAFTGHRSIFQAGERISLGAQWRDLRGQPLQGRSMDLLLGKAGDALGQDAQRYSFGPLDPQTGAALVDLPALAPGKYWAQLIGAGDPPLNGPRTELTVLDHSVEDTQVRMDRRQLVQLSSRLGGTFYDQTEENAVPDLVAGMMAVPLETTQSVKRRRYDFWARWPFLFLVSVLLGTEWFLRRRSGML